MNRSILRACAVYLALHRKTHCATWGNLHYAYQSLSSILHSHGAINLLAHRCALRARGMVECVIALMAGGPPKPQAQQPVAGNRLQAIAGNRRQSQAVASFWAARSTHTNPRLTYLTQKQTCLFLDVLANSVSARPKSAETVHARGLICACA